MKTPHRYQTEIYAVEEFVRTDRKRSLTEARKQKYRFALRLKGSLNSFYIGEDTQYYEGRYYSSGHIHYAEDPNSRMYFATATQAVEFKHSLIIPVDVVWAYIPPSEQPDKVASGDKSTKTE